MYEVIYTGQFKKSLKLCVRRGLDIQAFMDVLDILQEKGELPPQISAAQITWQIQGLLGMSYPAKLVAHLATG